MFNIISNSTVSFILPLNKTPNLAWNGDRSDSKKTALNQLSYIVFLINPSKKNPYYNYSEEDRSNMLKKDFDIDKIDILIEEALAKYSKLITSRHKRLITAALDSSDQLTTYYKNVKFDSAEFDLKEYQDSLTKLSKSLKDLKELEKQLELDNEEEGGRVKGGNEIGAYEIPR